MLASGPPLLLCFRLSQLLGFYAETVAQLAGPAAALVAALQAAQVRSLPSMRGISCCTNRTAGRDHALRPTSTTIPPAHSHTAAVVDVSRRLHTSLGCGCRAGS